MTIKWSTFLDKVYGCWLGKCVSGTIGAPYEGYKGKMNVTYTPKLFEKMLPNDDLDLQVLWLDVIERVGPDFTSDDLAEAFYKRCPYSPGEYATFKKNYELGLRPPLTGKYNNTYYVEGMGCPIRSEIWACMAPGDAKLAAALAYKDGCLDHYGESIIAEQYLAALEALAFADKWDIRGLVIKALEYIDNNSKFYELVGRILAWCDENPERDYVYGRILRDYGHADCTNMYQNMGITLMALLLGNGDLVETTMLALNCGFDTDCTCATVGAIIGIVCGGESMIDKYDLPEQFYKLGVDLTRRSDKVYDLAEDTAYAALLFCDYNKKTTIKDAPLDRMPHISIKGRFPLAVSVSYQNDDPTIRPGQSRDITVKLTPLFKMKLGGSVTLTVPEGFTVKPESKNFKLTFFNPELNFTISASKDIPVMHECNIINCCVELESGDVHNETFGIVGAQSWKVYGPFWENTTYAPPPKELESYYAHLGGGSNEDDALTIMRQFHLNMKADIQKEYLEDQLLGSVSLNDELVGQPEYTGFPVYLTEDRFNFEMMMSNSMPCVIYMVRDLYSPAEETVCLQIGHSDAFRMWINGNMTAYSDVADHWTPENIHRKNITLNKGFNRIVLKLARTGGTTDFSVIFTESGACTNHISHYGSGRVI